MFRKNEKGFTLIEIIVVVVILAVLMAVAVPAVLKYINTAQEAPALTETYAIVTAAQKKVIEKYSQNRDDNIFLYPKDNEWIEDFVGEGGKIQGSITVSNKEVTRLLYLASNGLYVLYENQEYKIVDENESNHDVLSQMVIDYTKQLKDLYNSGEIKLYACREDFIKKLANKSGLVKVDENLTKKSGSATDLYWKPYYLHSVADPSIVMFANKSNNDHGGWSASLVYVNGNIYKCTTNIAYFRNYDSPDELLNYLESNSDIYQKIE